MKIRTVAFAGTVIMSAVLAISAQSASASVPTIGHLAAVAPAGTQLSVCELAIKVPACEGIPGPVISAMSGVPANSAGAVRVARSLGLTGDSPAFTYCHGDRVSGARTIGRECIFISVLV